MRKVPSSRGQKPVVRNGNGNGDGDGRPKPHGNGNGNGDGQHKRPSADGNGGGDGQLIPPLWQADRLPAQVGLNKTELLGALMKLKRGDFSIRLPVDFEGMDGKIADTFNDVIELNERMAAELERLSRV